MKQRTVLFILLIVAALSTACCTEQDTINPSGKEFSRTLAVLNEEYAEVIILDELSEPVTVTSTRNIPYWLSVEAQEGVNNDGHPILKVNVKKEDNMEEDRRIQEELTRFTKP